MSSPRQALLISLITINLGWDLTKLVNNLLHTSSGVGAYTVSSRGENLYQAKPPHSYLMIHGYFKIGIVSCQIISDTSLSMNKIRLLTISAICPHHIYVVCGHHSSYPIQQSWDNKLLFSTSWILPWLIHADDIQTVDSKLWITKWELI